MIKAKIKREPVMTAATITALVSALIVLFVPDLEGQQKEALIVVAVIAAPLLFNVLARARVTPWEPDQ